MSGLWLTLYHVQLTAQTWQVENLLQICAWMLLLDLFDFIEKPFEMASRRNDSVVKGSKSHQTCSAWTFYPLSVKETCDIECWGLRQPLSEYSFFLPIGA